MSNDPNLARKNWAFFGILAGLVALLFIITILRFGGAATAS